MANRFNLNRFNLKIGGAIQPENKPVVNFGGRSIEDAVPGVKIINVIVGAVEVESYADARNTRAGSDYLRNRDGTRPITVIVELPLTRSVYDYNVRKLRAWASSKKPMALQLPIYKNDQIFATLTSFSEFSPRDWWLPVEMVFTAWNPHFENVGYSTVPVGTSFTIGGSGDPSVRIELDIDGSVTNPEWSFETGEKLKLVGTFAAGKIEIDMDTLMIYHNGESAMQYLTISSRFPRFSPGVWLVEGAAGSVVKWKERWK